MNLAETLRMLRRRWYVVVTGVLIAAAGAYGVWQVVPPGYERSATQMLLPGVDSVPTGGNPYIYIGGLTQAADVVVRAVGSKNVIEDVTADHPTADIVVQRDPSASGPLIEITVTAESDAASEEILGALVDRTGTVLGSLQDEEQIIASNRIKVIPITIDQQGTLEQKNRIVATAGAGIGVVVLTLILAAALDGVLLSRSRSRAGRKDRGRLRSTAQDAPAQDGAVLVSDEDQAIAADQAMTAEDEALAAEERAEAEADAALGMLLADDGADRSAASDETEEWTVDEAASEHVGTGARGGTTTRDARKR